MISKYFKFYQLLFINPKDSIATATSLTDNYNEPNIEYWSE